MLNFDFLGMGLELVSPSHVLHEFSRKMFLVSYSTNNISFSDCLYLFRCGVIWGERGGIISDADGQGGWGVLKIGHFHGRHMCIIPTGQYVHSIY